MINQLSIRIKIMFALGLVVVLALGSTFYWMAWSHETQIIQQINGRAKALFQNAVLTRAWVAAQGGVFIEKQGDVETNPYLLEVPGLEVEFEGENGKGYTLRNPALVTRELSELGTERGEDFAFHITSLKPLNPHNAPTDWEAQALRNFEQGATEASIIETKNGIKTYRYMAPLPVTEACLGCHEHQGYKVGDVRGGISVSVPMTEARAAIIETRQQLLLAGIGVIVAVLLILYFVVNRLVLHPLRVVEETAQDISRGHLDRRVPIQSRDEIGSLAGAFNIMTDQVHELVATLEDRVADRTRRLEVVVDVSQRFSAILELETLMREVVTVTKEAFNYYHAHIYLLNKETAVLIMTEGYGEAGAEMKRQGHSIPLNAARSLVARAARWGEAVIVENTREDPDWLPNPLLPDTRSEMAIPVMLGQEVIGVLDVQSAKVDGLTAGDEAILRILANQIAIAARNARLFTEAQEALEEAQSIQRAYISQAWGQFGVTHTITNYEVRQPGSLPLEQISVPEAAAALQQLRTVDLSTALKAGPLAPGGNGGSEGQSGDSQSEIQNRKSKMGGALATPMKLGDQIIGVLGIRDDNSERRWTEDEIALIESVSEQMSLAIENARLFEDTQRSAWRDRVVSETTAQVWSSDEVTDVMKAAVAQLGERLKASEVVIQLGASQLQAEIEAEQE